jgi:hypothetical protein
MASWLHFEPPQLLNFDHKENPDPAFNFDSDKDPAFHSDGDPNPAFQNNTDPCGSESATLVKAANAVNRLCLQGGCDLRATVVAGRLSLQD